MHELQIIFLKKKIGRKKTTTILAVAWMISDEITQVEFFFSLWCSYITGNGHFLPMVYGHMKIAIHTD